MKTFTISFTLLILSLTLTFIALLVSSKTQAAIDSNCTVWVYCPDMTITFNNHLTPITLSHESAKILAAYSLLLAKHGLAAIVVLAITTLYSFSYAVSHAFIALQLRTRKDRLGL